MIASRIRRVIRLLTLLRQFDGLALREIARRLECSQRTVYRDLELLKEFGFDVVWTREGYRVEPEDPLPMVTLEREELLALIATLTTSPLIHSDQTRDHVRRALEKLIGACSAKTRNQWLHLSRRLQSIQRLDSPQPVGHSPTRHFAAIFEEMRESDHGPSPDSDSAS